MKQFWEGLTAETAPDAIITNAKHTVETLHEIQQEGWEFLPTGDDILDFACGVGRNSYRLQNNFKNVYCYDLPNMISIMKSTEKFKKDGTYLHVYDSWEHVSWRTFDAIFCCLALQHIYEKELLAYMQDFALMTRNLYVFTRSYNDDNKKNMLELLERHFTFVKALGKSYEEIQAASGEDHYFVHMEAK